MKIELHEIRRFNNMTHDLFTFKKVAVSLILAMILMFSGCAYNHYSIPETTYMYNSRGVYIGKAETTVNTTYFYSRRGKFIGKGIKQ